MRKIIGPHASLFTKGNMYNTIPGDRKMVLKGRKTASVDAQQRRPRIAMPVNQNENTPGRERAVANPLGISPEK